MEDERMISVPITAVVGRVSPPTIHLSPSRQSSSSTDHDVKGNASSNNVVGTTVAKKKRELFSSARSSRSGGSNQSSASDYSREHSFSSKVILVAKVTTHSNMIFIEGSFTGR